MKNDYINEQIGDEEKRKIMIRNVKLMKCKNKCDGSVCSVFKFYIRTPISVESKPEQ